MTDKRDQSGRFAEGNAGGPGRPKRQTERDYLRVVMGKCTLEEWAEAVTKAVKDAKAGDAKAREWLSGYLLGKPNTAAPSLLSIALDEEAGVSDLHPNDVRLAELTAGGKKRATY